VGGDVVIPVDFPEKTKTLQKPPSMTDEECSPLHVYSDGEVCISCWRPSWRERLSILWHGRIWLYVASGPTQPPVSLDACRTVFRREGP
jgi:hypothetical protein